MGLGIPLAVMKALLAERSGVLIKALIMQELRAMFWPIKLGGTGNGKLEPMLEGCTSDTVSYLKDCLILTLGTSKACPTRIVCQGSFRQGFLVS